MENLENLGKSGDRPLQTLDFIGYRRVCPQKASLSYIKS